MNGKWALKFFSLIIILTMALATGAVPVYAELDWRIISANPFSDWVYALGWPLGSELTLTIAGNTADYEATTIDCSWIQGQTVATFFLAGMLDLVPGNEITVTGAGITRTVTITNFAVTNLDMATNTISGIGESGRSITLCADNASGVCRWAVVGESGTWSMPPVPGTFILQPGVRGWSSEKEPDDDETFAFWNVPNPRFDVRANWDTIEGYEWPVENEVILYQDGTEIDRTQADGSGYVRFDLAGSLYGIQAQDEITLISGQYTKTTTVKDLAITGNDPNADTISGITNPNTELDVSACDAIDCPSRHVMAQGDGTWVADFSVEEPGTGQRAVDIVPGMWVDSKQLDEDNDSTMYGLGLPYPLEVMVANPHEDWVVGIDWPVGSLVTMTIEGKYTDSITVVPAPWDPVTDTSAAFYLSGIIDLAPGDTIIMTDGTVPKTLVVANVFVTDMDVAGDTLSGTASPGTTVTITSNAPGDQRRVLVEEDGNWVSGPVFGAFVLAPGVCGSVYEDDPDGDSTRYDWCVPNPVFEVDPGRDEVAAYYWPVGDTLILSMDGVELGRAVTFYNGWTGEAHINLAGTFDIQEGQLLSITNGDTTKTTVVTSLEIIGYSLAADTINGTIDPNTNIIVYACDPEGCSSRFVRSDGNGNWIANYAAPEPETGNRAVDIVPGTYVYVQRLDEDNDLTWTSVNIPNPRFDVRANDDTVEAWEWPIGDPLTLTIGDQNFYAVAEPADWAPYGSFASFNLAGQVDIQVGQTWTITNNDFTKTTTVTELAITGYEFINDTISGIANPNTELDVWACDEIDCPNRHVMVQEDGTWVAYFGAEEPGTGQRAVDIVPGMWVDSQQSDEDSDRTMYGWSLPAPSTGKAVGRGWYTSPGGALISNPVFVDKAIFSFDVKYGKKSADLKGSATLVMKGLRLQSTSFDWLVIEGSRMQLSGLGKVNGSGGYAFLINAANNSAGKATIGIRVWETDTGEVVYDSMLGSPSNIPPTIAVKGGKIAFSK